MIDCTLTLEDVARMNDLLDVMDENDMRARRAAREEEERR